MSRSDDLAAVIRDATVTGTGNSVVVVGGEPGLPKSLTADGKPFNPMFCLSREAWGLMGATGGSLTAPYDTATAMQTAQAAAYWRQATTDALPGPMPVPVNRITELERENAELRAALLRYRPAAVDARRAIGPLTEDELAEMQLALEGFRRPRLSASWEALGDVAAPVPVEVPPFPSRALRRRVGQAIGLIER
jgi:hypothetical protein